MAKAIRTNNDNFTSGFADIGQYRGRIGTVDEIVHDGDTLNVELRGSTGIRLLGIDTPEVSFLFPGSGFISIGDDRWTQFLTDPLNDRWGPMQTDYPDGLKYWVKARIGPDTAQAHYDHARRAEKALEREIELDRNQMQQSLDEFGFYLAFGYEVMDRYGRLLCLVNRNQPSRTEPSPRPPTYNLRLLEQGMAYPYFIWPNINPWDKQDSIADAVIKPGTAKTVMTDNEEIRRARSSVAKARAAHAGLYDANNPMLLEPFELRYLSRRGGPSRYLIDLTKNDDVLLHPLNYFTVAHSEDRLWIPGIYVPLFVEHGWKKQPSPV